LIDIIGLVIERNRGSTAGRSTVMWQNWSSCSHKCLYYYGL